MRLSLHSLHSRINSRLSLHREPTQAYIAYTQKIMLFKGKRAKKLWFSCGKKRF